MYVSIFFSLYICIVLLVYKMLLQKKISSLKPEHFSTRLTGFVLYFLLDMRLMLNNTVVVYLFVVWHLLYLNWVGVHAVSKTCFQCLLNNFCIIYFWSDFHEIHYLYRKYYFQMNFLFCMRSCMYIFTISGNWLFCGFYK